MRGWCGKPGRWLMAAAMVGTASPLLAQDVAPPPEAAPETVPPSGELGRSAENAIRTAGDAFGTSIGRETIGLYSSQNIRGFSPISAGNARIEGLYFDQVWGLTSRIRRSTTVRVGISALGFPFPAPTGIVDYSFRRPGREASLGLAAGVDSYGAAFVEGDAAVPVSGEQLAVGVVVLGCRLLGNADPSIAKPDEHRRRVIRHGAGLWHALRQAQRDGGGLRGCLDFARHERILGWPPGPVMGSCLRRSTGC